MRRHAKSARKVRMAARCYTDRIGQFWRLIMRRLAVCMLLVFAVPAVFAVDLGRAEGSLNVGGTAVPLAYAYVMDGAHNDLTGRNDATKIILTDKPLPAGTRLADVDSNFPEGILGVVVCMNKDQQPQHLVVQHPNGM